MQQPYPPLTWDVFCHVIDNWGDLGVCWRLCSQLLAHGQHVRLWVDDAAPLQWMAPGALEGRIQAMEVHHWPRTQHPAQPPQVPAGDVLVEAFGCDIAPEWVLQLQPDTQHRVWLNLEYLSAESYVERSHLLPSPIMNGPLAGRTKWFFYPGFTPQTGGLLREPHLLATQAQFDPPPWLAQHGVAATASPVVTLFCYEPAHLAELTQQPGLAHAHWLVTHGRAQTAMQHVGASHPALVQRTTHLPPLAQTDFDQVLWSADLNLVRGEDSLVRALWAGKPLVWHIYPQDDHAHHAKLDAFLDWLQAPPCLRHFHRVWNGISPGPLPAPKLPLWQACILAARQRLLAQTDLASQLLDFVAEKR